MDNVKVEGLAQAIVSTMEIYNETVEKDLETAKAKVTQDTVRELKAESPKRTGGYAKGWGDKKDGDQTIIYNRRHPNRTHLLEKGHAKRNGGRVDAIPHIAPAEEKAVKAFEEAVKKAIQ